jgi:hypothetical protein
MVPRFHSPHTENAASGFSTPTGPVLSPRLTRAVAATLTLGAISLCLAISLTLLSAKLAIALPISTAMGL